MILCNETIASHFFAKEIPFIYRSHEEPTKEKLFGLQTMIANVGIQLKSRTTAKSLQQLLENAKQTTAAYAVSSALLRALPQANYTPDNPTHFGLASEAYCHFTSPIRRYADLQIHRIIKGATVENLHEISAQCSRTERIAEGLERDVADLKSSVYGRQRRAKI
jgi:ribonuclease R